MNDNDNEFVDDLTILPVKVPPVEKKIKHKQKNRKIATLISRQYIFIYNAKIIVIKPNNFKHYQTYKQFTVNAENNNRPNFLV